MNRSLALRRFVLAAPSALALIAGMPAKFLHAEDAVAKPSADVSAKSAEPAPELVKMVVGLISEKDKDMRAIGYDQVRDASTKGTAATKEFAAQLSKLPPDAQIGLLQALAVRNDLAARDEVVKLLETSPEPTVRIAAIRALGPLGSLADISSLAKSLKSESKDEQAAARLSLIGLLTDGAPLAIAKEMATSEPTVRIKLIEILAERRAFEAMAELIHAANCDDAKVRGAAMIALGQLAGPTNLKGMIDGVLRAERGGERDAAERAIVAMADRLENQENRVDVILEAITIRSKEDQTLLLPTLGRLGGKKALAVIESMISMKDAAIHDAAIRAICNWPDASVADRLIQLSKSESKPENRQMAMSALIRVAPLPDGRSDEKRLELLKQTLTMATRDEDRDTVIKRARAVRSLDAMRFVLPFVDDPKLSETASETVVELAHHRNLREPNKPEFDKALDKVLATSKNATTLDRATRYKNGQTWVKPKEEAN